MLPAPWGRERVVTLLQMDQNPALGQGYLHNFADDPVEKAHQLASGQLDLLFQLVHRLVLQAEPQEESLEDGKSWSGRRAGPGPSKH